jgi:hypothetical protein
MRLKCVVHLVYIPYYRIVTLSSQFNRVFDIVQKDPF